jgi:hypothetical protein
MIPIIISWQAAGFPVRSTHFETRFLQIFYIKRWTILNLLHQTEHERYSEQMQFLYNMLLTQIPSHYTGFFLEPVMLRKAMHITQN